MDENSIEKMDPYMLLSMVNTRLRDRYSSLDSLCEDMDVNIETLIDKIGKTGYKYNTSLNKFVSE